MLLYQENLGNGNEENSNKNGPQHVISNCRPSSKIFLMKPGRYKDTLSTQKLK